MGGRVQQWIDVLSDKKAPELLISISGVVAVAFGLAVLADQRLPDANTFRLALTIAPQWVWGSAWLIAGVACIAGLQQRRSGFLPALCLAGIYMVWSGIIIVTPNSLSTAWVAYTALSLFSSATALLSTATHQEAPHAV